MCIVCLWSPDWATAGAPLAELAALLLDDTPRVAVEARGVLWADARGLPAPRLAWALLRRLGDPGRSGVRAGVSGVPVAAEVAARSGESPVTFVEAGHERSFLHPRPLALLGPDPKLAALLDGVGIRRCGELAALERGSVEVRFGAAGSALWRRARADDPRLLFGPIPREAPHASLDFVDYEVRSAPGLLFTANALLGSVCATAQDRGTLIRALTIELPLSDRTTWIRTLRAARPTAQRTAWLRRIQEVFDALILPDAVTGIRMRAESSEPAASFSSQGDVFDRGFATAAAAEEALCRLVDRQGAILVVPETSAHPLPERQLRWAAREVEGIVADAPCADPVEATTRPTLDLHLLRDPRRVAVRARPRTDHRLPTRYLDPQDGGRWRILVAAAGPHRVSGGQWEEHPYAREYFRCVTEEGRMVWLFRDARENVWYLHGWWD